jgi:hypothetical protein
MAMLAGVVKGVGNLEQVLPAASALAKRHVSYGAKAEDYPVVGAALLWTLEKGLGDGWTPEVADAWGAIYGTLSGYMISEAYGRSQAPSKIIVGDGMAAVRLVGMARPFNRWPISTLPSTFAPAHSSTPSRTFGCRSPRSLPVPPSVTSGAAGRMRSGSSGPLTAAEALDLPLSLHTATRRAVARRRRSTRRCRCAI